MYFFNVLDADFPQIIILYVVKHFIVAPHYI